MSLYKIMGFTGHGRMLLAILSKCVGVTIGFAQSVDVARNNCQRKVGDYWWGERHRKRHRGEMTNGCAIRLATTVDVRLASLNHHNMYTVRGIVVATLTAILTLALLPWAPDSWALDAKQIFQKAQGSVVLVMSFDEQGQPPGIGSGFFVGDGKVVATNHHVIEGASSVKVKTTNGNVFRIQKALGVDLERDIVLLEIPATGSPLKLSNRTPEVGEDIVAIGNPKGLDGTLSRGIVSGIREDGDARYYQITAPISPGSSGGPILDNAGEVLGVSTFYISGGQNLNFAVPSSYVRGLLNAPRQTSLANITGEKANVLRKGTDERVYGTDAYIDGSESYLEASVVNKTDHPITNVRLIAIFYGNSQNPLHFMLVNIGETIPAGLGKRFKRQDSALEGHGVGRIFGSKGAWDVSLRVVDYEIISDENESIPVFD